MGLLHPTGTPQFGFKEDAAPPVAMLGHLVEVSRKNQLSVRWMDVIPPPIWLLFPLCTREEGIYQVPYPKNK
jgi:hypothetical protein